MENLQKQLSAQALKLFRSKTIHLGIFAEPYLTYMLNGQKTIESRFSKNKILPYDKISKDDIVIVKKSSGNILAYLTIKDVKFFDLKENSIEEIKKNYQDKLCVDNSFWLSKKDSNYATLIFIDKIFQLTPFSIPKKGMQTWITLNKMI